MPPFDRLLDRGDGESGDEEPGEAPPAAPERPKARPSPEPTAKQDDAGGKGRPRGKAEDVVLKVSQVNRAVDTMLQHRFSDVRIVGELSNVRPGGNGHVYFTLNDLDVNACLPGVMFNRDARRARARLENGALVQMRGALNLYRERGRFQLVARSALPAGEGALHAELELRRRRLEEEGLLAPERKRPLPHAPRVVGVVTSESGAALGDIIRVAQTRCPVRIFVADCRVQGDGAARSIGAALRRIQRLPELDVVIVGRGGGSSEDLWAFNDEALAREIAACRVPTVSAVGHQQDLTLADLVADLRAATPSNAAELVVPEREVLLRELDGQRRQARQGIRHRLQLARRELDRAERGLPDPRYQLARARGRLVALTTTLNELARRRLERSARGLGRLDEAVRRGDPKARLARDRGALTGLERSLEEAAARRLRESRQRLEGLGARAGAAGRPLVARARGALALAARELDALSPLRVLERGYAVALRDGRALVDANTMGVGDPVEVRLHRGRLFARVDSVEGPAPDGHEGGPRETSSRASEDGPGDGDG